MPRPSNRDERRRAIRKALLRVMAQKGYERATIADIAAEAGLSPGLLHYHYPSKQKILLDLIERMEAFRRKNLDAALARAGSNPALQIEAFVDAHLDLTAIDPDALAAWTAMGTEALRDGEVRDRFHGLLHGSQQRLVAILERGVQQSAFVPMNPQAVAAALIALIQGFFFVASTTSGLIPPGSAAPSARRMARALLLDPPAMRRQGP